MRLKKWQKVEWTTVNKVLSSTYLYCKTTCPVTSIEPKVDLHKQAVATGDSDSCLKVILAEHVYSNHVG